MYPKWGPSGIRDTVYWILCCVLSLSVNALVFLCTLPTFSLRSMTRTVANAVDPVVSQITCHGIGTIWHTNPGTYCHTLKWNATPPTDLPLAIGRERQKRLLGLGSCALINPDHLASATPTCHLHVTSQRDDAVIAFHDHFGNKCHRLWSASSPGNGYFQ